MNKDNHVLKCLADIPTNCLLGYLSPQEIHNFSQVCRSFRQSSLNYLETNPEKRVLLNWDYGSIEVDRSVIIERKKKRRVIRTDRNNYTHKFMEKISVEEYQFLLKFLKPAFSIIHIRARTLDETTLDNLDYLALKGSAKMPNQTLIIDVDNCHLTSERLCEVLTVFQPLALQFYGLFDRSVITGDAIPLMTQNLLVMEHPIDETNHSRLDYAFFSRMIESWKNTTDDGLIMGRPEYEMQITINYDGNYRRMDIDKCIMSRIEIARLQVKMLLGLRRQQIIHFYNVQDLGLLHIHANMMLTFLSPLLRRRFVIRNDRIRAGSRELWSFQVLRSRTHGNAIVLQKTPAGQNRASTEAEILERPSILSMVMHFYRDSMGRKSVFPETKVNLRTQLKRFSPTRRQIGAFSRSGGASLGHSRILHRTSNGSSSIESHMSFATPANIPPSSSLPGSICSNSNFYLNRSQGNSAQPGHFQPVAPSIPVPTGPVTLYHADGEPITLYPSGISFRLIQSPDGTWRREDISRSPTP